MNHKAILEKLRLFMKQNNLDFFIVSATDEYLSEYIKLNENARYNITGFSGSTGDAIVTLNDVFLFVDGRYHLQAENQVDKNLITVIKVGIDISPATALIEKIAELSQKNQKIGFVSTKVNMMDFKRLNEVFSIKKLSYQEFSYDPILQFTDKNTDEVESVKYIPINISGIGTEEKFNLIRKGFNDINIDIYVLTKLEGIAYITNLRGNEIPYNSTFKAKAIIYKDKLIIFTDLSKIPQDIIEKLGGKFEFKDKSLFASYLNNLQNTPEQVNIGYHPRWTNVFTYRQFENTKNNLIKVINSPVIEVVAIKNDAEIAHMQECFRKTDIVVSRAISWINQNLERQVNISEKDFADKVKSLFIEEGACGLSFEVIAASGKNTAIIHYTNPDPKKYIKTGDLVLLDCGAYFEGGYATDITRTFLAGGLRATASDEAKKIYTKVLKALLNGLNYNISDETTGFDIDKTVRDIVTKNTDESFKFPHGTGHGIGMAVHESIPRLGPSEFSKIKLKTGMCFTIEPGLYNDNWGGVRIENTVTIVKTAFGNKIKSFTRSKFDENLINYNDLNKQEISWLKDYQKKAMG